MFFVSEKEFPETKDPAEPASYTLCSLGSVILLSPDYSRDVLVNRTALAAGGHDGNRVPPPPSSKLGRWALPLRAAIRLAHVEKAEP